MIKIKKQEITSLEGLVFYRSVPELNGGDINGYVESWNYSEKERFPDSYGINVKDEEVLKYAAIVSSGQGLYIADKAPCGITSEGKMYHIRSYLVNGVVLSNLVRREEFGREGSGISVGELMPKRIIRIVSERSERLLETARLLKLPVDKIAVEAA